MNLQHKICELSNVLPFQADLKLLEDILLKSSHIDFSGKGEFLFKEGDPPLGFYWILKGEVEILIPDKTVVHLKAGDMAGLDCFLNREVHPFSISTSSSSVKTIFINRPCFKGFAEQQQFRKLINQQVLYCLISYKSLLYTSTELLLK